MADHYQRWQPDTCDGAVSGDGCSFIQHFDDALPPEETDLTHHLTEGVCGLHEDIPDPKEHYERVLAENRRKNTAFALLRAFDTTLPYADYRWSFDRSGLLTVTLGRRQDALRAHARDLQAACDLQFGPGLALIQ